MQRDDLAIIVISCIIVSTLLSIYVSLFAAAIIVVSTCIALITR